MGKNVTIHINGCNVTCPAEQEQLYRKTLADHYFDGYRVYVENGKVLWTPPEGSKGTSPDILKEMLIDQNRKIFALKGQLYEF